MQRRFLPPLAWLTAFEAVARLGSVTRAARELDLTQSAVSRQVMKLEARIGTRLFIRRHRRLALTPAGRAYAAELGEAIARIGQATLRAATNPGGGVLELAILPAFGTHWLAPRLPRFLARNPGITLNLTTRTRVVDFAAENLHAAIHFGQAPGPGTGALELAEETLLPVLSPGLPKPGGKLTARALAGLPLLHLESRRSGWARWFAENGVPDAPPPGMLFDQFATMQQAVLAGLGAALLPDWLVGADLAAGRLSAPAGTRPARLGAYFLIWPESLAEYPPLAAFRRWLAGEVGN